MINEEDLNELTTQPMKPVEFDYMYIFHINTDDNVPKRFLQDVDDIPAELGLSAVASAVSHPVTAVIYTFHEHLNDDQLAAIQVKLHVDASNRSYRVFDVQLVHAEQVSRKA